MEGEIQRQNIETEVYEVWIKICKYKKPGLKKISIFLRAWKKIGWNFFFYYFDCFKNAAIFFIFFPKTLLNCKYEYKRGKSIARKIKSLVWYFSWCHGHIKINVNVHEKGIKSWKSSWYVHVHAYKNSNRNKLVQLCSQLLLAFLQRWYFRGKY